MKQFTKILVSFLLLISMATFCQAAVYHIVFNADDFSTSGRSYDENQVNISSIFNDYKNKNDNDINNDEKPYVESLKSYTNLYYYSSKGIVVGKNTTTNKTGKISLNIGSSYQSNISKISFNASKYSSSDNYTYSISINNEPKDKEISPTNNYCYTLDKPSQVTNITIETTGRIYFSEIVIETIEHKNLTSLNDSPYWATFSNDDHDVFFTATTDVKTARISDGKLILPVIDKSTYKGTEGTYVAKGTGVMLKSTTGNEASYYIVEDASFDETYNDGNLLHASSSIIDGDYNFYVLSTGENGIGFYWDTDKGATLTETWTGGAYLAIPDSQLGLARGFVLDDIEAGIHSVSCDAPINTIYTIDGRIIKSSENKIEKGFYIINNKKIIIK